MEKSCSILEIFNLILYDRDLRHERANPVMRNTRFLKCVRPLWDIINLRLNGYLR